MVPGAGSNATASITNNTHTIVCVAYKNVRSTGGDDSKSDPNIGGIVSTRSQAIRLSAAATHICSNTDRASSTLLQHQSFEVKNE